MPSQISVPGRLLAVLLALSVALVACSGGSDPDTTGTSGATSQGGASTTLVSTTTTLPQDNPLVQAELTVEVDGATIIFDQRPFTLMDASGRVQVLAPGGAVLTEGPFEGPDSVMRQLPDGSFEFVASNGTVVATMSQQQLNDAMTRAAEEHRG